MAGARHTLTVQKVGDQLNNQRLAVVVSNDHGVNSCVVDLLTYRGILCTPHLLSPLMKYPRMF